MARRKRRGRGDTRRKPPARRPLKASNGLMLAATGLLAVAATAGLWLWRNPPADATEVLVYKSPSCGCCSKWIDHLEDKGFRVKTKNVSDLGQIRAYHGVEQRLASCHTAIVEGYVVEGHVPAKDIKRLLTERPKVKGLAVPGMPMGSPGMEGPRSVAYDTLTFDSRGRTSVFAAH